MSIGTAVALGDYPSFGSLIRSNIGDIPCSAVLIHKDMMLTSATCKGLFKGKQVAIGGTIVDGSNADEKINVVDEYPYPFYDVFDAILDNIMMIKLQGPSAQQPASIISFDPLFNTTGHRIGYEIDIINPEKAKLMAVDYDVFSCKYNSFSIYNTPFTACGKPSKKEESCRAQNYPGEVIMTDRNSILGILNPMTPCSNNLESWAVLGHSYKAWINTVICTYSSFIPVNCNALYPSSSPTLASQVQVPVKTANYTANIIELDVTGAFFAEIKIPTSFANKCDDILNVQVLFTIVNEVNLQDFIVALKSTKSSFLTLAGHPQNFYKTSSQATTFIIDDNFINSYNAVLTSNCLGATCPGTLSFQSNGLNLKRMRGRYISNLWTLYFISAEIKEIQFRDITLSFTCKASASTMPSTSPSALPSNKPSQLLSGVPSTSPSNQPIKKQQPCGLLRKGILCLKTKCGILGRLFGWCKRSN